MSRVLEILLMSATVLLSPVALGEVETCADLRTRNAEPQGLIRYQLESVDGDRIPNIDLDGDDISDDIRLSCPGASGAVPSDPCTFNAKLSSTGKEITYEADRFYMIHRRGRAYLVAMVDGKRAILAVDKRGVRVACKGV